MDAKFGFEIFFNHILTAVSFEMFFQYIMFLLSKRVTMINSKKEEEGVYEYIGPPSSLLLRVLALVAVDSMDLSYLFLCRQSTCPF